MENGIQTTQTALSPVAMVADLMQQTDGKFDVSQLDALLAVQERYEANEARKAYHVAMAAFKKDPPKILKDKNVSFGNTNYNHATLANVTKTIDTVLSSHGLTSSWVTDSENGSIKVTCKITHVLGHSESTCLSAAPDTSGKKNPIQAIGSTVTYLQRYTLLALTGLATSEQDDDGAGAGKPSSKVEQPSEGEQRVISAICKLIKAPEGLCVDKKRVTAFLYSTNSKYPPADLPKKKIETVAQTITNQNRSDIFAPFEEAYDMQGDNDTLDNMPESGDVNE